MEREFQNFEMDRQSRIERVAEWAMTPIMKVIESSRPDVIFNRTSSSYTYRDEGVAGFFGIDANGLGHSVKLKQKKNSTLS